MMTGIDSTTVTNNTSTSGSNSTSTSGVSEDRFLKLLVAQLNNQDPLNPMDNAQMTTQMAQISTVTSVQQVDSTLKGLATQLTAMQMLQGSTLVGHDVVVSGKQLAVRDGKANGAVELDVAASNVKVQVVSGGKVVDTIDMGAVKAGRTSFTWDASKYPGVVSPTIEVTATANGKAITAKTFVQDRVTSITTDSTSGLQLQLEKLGLVAYSTVSGIH
jgi:flagellar basal-body rod modification protein FlgD